MLRSFEEKAPWNEKPYCVSFNLPDLMFKIISSCNFGQLILDLLVEVNLCHFVLVSPQWVLDLFQCAKAVVLHIPVIDEVVGTRPGGE